jgi:N-acetylglucosamine kinase-like BadF-type ATPase
MQVLIGVDGGGSKTTALLADVTGKILGRGLAGPSNYLSTGKEAAEEAVVLAIRKAYLAAGKEFEPADAVCLGLASVDEAEDPVWALRWAESISLGRKIVVVDDQELVLQAGTPSGIGLGLICGTGSVVFGRRRDGRKVLSGGWGYALGDEGSGYAIGLDALKAIAQMMDGIIPKTNLMDLVFDHWNLSSGEELFYKLNLEKCSSREIAQLASLVTTAESDGDIVAHQILQTAGQELALCFAGAARQMDFDNPFPCGMGGGVITNNPVIYETLMTSLNKNKIRLEPVKFVGEPAEGALVLAGRMQAGEKVEWIPANH